MVNKILLVGTDRKYFYAEKDRLQGLKKGENYVLATDVVPYGLQFKFGPLEEIDFRVPNINISNDKQVEVNLYSVINGLEEMIKEAEADFVLLDDFHLAHTDFYGKGQLLIKR
jgi:hypothetical protein